MSLANVDNLFYCWNAIKTIANTLTQRQSYWLIIAETNSLWRIKVSLKYLSRSGRLNLLSVLNFVSLIAFIFLVYTRLRLSKILLESWILCLLLTRVPGWDYFKTIQFITSVVKLCLKRCFLTICWAASIVNYVSSCCSDLSPIQRQAHASKCRNPSLTLHNLRSIPSALSLYFSLQIEVSQREIYCYHWFNVLHNGLKLKTDMCAQ